MEKFAKKKKHTEWKYTTIREQNGEEKNASGKKCINDKVIKLKHKIWVKKKKKTRNKKVHSSIKTDSAREIKRNTDRKCFWKNVHQICD